MSLQMNQPPPMYQEDEEYDETSSHPGPLLPPDDRGIALTCELCSQYLCFATQTICNHIFCEGCLDQYLLYLNECPQCRTRIREEVSFSNKLLDNIILDYIKTYDGAELQGFNLRLKKHHDFKRNSIIEKSKFIQGLQVDILDKNHIWCTGKIIKVIDNDDSEIEQVMVKYDVSKRKQQISLPSTRLAVKGSYTNRKQIPHYQRKKIVFEDNHMVMEVTEWDQNNNNIYGTSTFPN